MAQQQDEHGGDAAAMRVAIEASRIANEALAQIKSHERVCDVRYQGIEKHMAQQIEVGKATKDSVSRIYDRMWTILGSAFLIVAGAIIAVGLWVYQQDRQDTQSRLDRAEQHYQQRR